MPDDEPSESSPVALMFGLFALAFLSGIVFGIVWCDSSCRYREAPLLEAFRAQIHTAMFPDQHRIAKKALDWGMQSLSTLVSTAAAGGIPAVMTR